MLNLIPRDVAVFVNGVDRSTSYKSFQGSDAKLSTNSGLLPFTGKLVLASPTMTLPVWMNVILNPGSWCRGIPVVVYQNGAIHPKGVLYILKTPSPAQYVEPGKPPELEIEVGCILAANSWREPDGNVTDTQFGYPLPLATVAQQILTYCGIIQSLPLTGTVNTPVIKQGGSYLEALGKYALGTGLAVLRDNQGVIEAIKIPNENGARDFATPEWTITPGTNEAILRFTAGPETPCEQVRAVGSTYDVKNQGNPRNVETVYAADGSIIRRTTKEDRWDLLTKTRIKTTTVEIIRSQCIPDTIYQKLGITVIPFPTFLVTAEETTETYFYELTGARRLLRVETETRQPYGIAYAQLITNYPAALTGIVIAPTIMTPEPTYTSTKTYTYDSLNGDVVKSINTQVRQPYGAILTATGLGTWDPTTYGFAFLMVDSQEVEQSWKELRPGQWEAKTVTYKPFIAVNPQSKLTTGLPTEKLLTYGRLTYSPNDSNTIDSTSGQANPPAAEKGPPDYSFQEVQVQSVMQLSRYGSPQWRDREVTLTFEGLPGKGIGAGSETPETNLEKLGKAFGQLKIGRALAVQVVTDLQDYKPFDRVEITGIGIFRIEAVTHAVADQKCTSAFEAYMEGRNGGVLTTTAVTTGAVGTGAVSIPVQPITRVIPSGSRIVINSTPVFVSSTVFPGATSIPVLPTTGDIPGGASGTYQEQVIIPPYQDQSIYTGGVVLGGSVDELPFSLTSSETITGGILVGGSIIEETLINQSILTGGVLVGGNITEFDSGTSETIAGGVLIGGSIAESTESNQGTLTGGVLVGGTITGSGGGPGGTLVWDELTETEWNEMTEKQWDSME